MTDKDAGADAPLVELRDHVDGELETRLVFIPQAYKLLFGGLAVVVLTIAAWGVAGTIVTEVSGRGFISLTGSEVYHVEGTVAAKVDDLLVGIGDQVEPGQVVALVSPLALAHEVRLADLKLAAMLKSLDALRARHDQELRSLGEATGSQLQWLTSALADARKHLTAMRNAQSTTADAEMATTQWQLRVGGLAAQMAELRIKILEAKAGLAAPLVAYEAEVAQQQQKVAALKRHLYEASKLHSPAGGVVDEILVNKGEVLGPGGLVMKVRSGGGNYDVLSFLPPSRGGRVSVGMAAHVIPDTVEEAQYGSMRGTVVAVSKGPISPQQVEAIVGNSELARDFVRGGAPYLVRIRLYADKRTPSGFEWWSGSGPPFAIVGQTLVNVTVDVNRQSPITLVAPVFHWILGR